MINLELFTSNLRFSISFLRLQYEIIQGHYVAFKASCTLAGLQNLEFGGFSLNGHLAHYSSDKWLIPNWKALT